MRHLGLEVHRLEKLMARQRGYSAAHQDADRQTGMHGYLLRYLHENQERDVFQRDIEKAFSISRSSVTVTLQLMEKNGLIRRESVAQDARLKRIVLTQKARDLHRQIEADILAFESNLARGISEEEQEVFLRVAKKMQENLREDLAKQGISICKGGDCE